MQADEQIAPLLGMPVARFMDEHWQRKPLHVAAALTPREVSGIGPQALFRAAALEDIEARLICGEALHYGPFDAAHFATLGQSDWILLVQNMDRVAPLADALLRRFAFLPSWRIDDVMISYAVPGGSAGPHVDQYDVFLIQGTGHKRWAIDESPSPDLSLRDDHALGLLRHFAPSRHWDMAPGDLLYLPPGVPHHGTALSSATTWSVGMRAPSAAELWVDFAEYQVSRNDDSRRFTDPGQRPQRNLIEASDLARVRRLLGGVEHTDDVELARWFGRLVTRREDLVVEALPGGAEDRPATAPVGGLRVAWFSHGEQGWVFADGSEFPTTAAAARLLGNSPQLNDEQLQQLATCGGATLLEQLRQAGLWVAGRA